MHLTNFFVKNIDSRDFIRYTNNCSYKGASYIGSITVSKTAELGSIPSAPATNHCIGYSMQ